MPQTMCFGVFIAPSSGVVQEYFIFRASLYPHIEISILCPCTVLYHTVLKYVCAMELKYKNESVVSGSK